MNRKKEILYLLIAIPVLFFCFSRLGGYYITAEAAFQAAERGARYGPSLRIGEIDDKEDGSKLMIGVGGDFLSAVTLRPAYGLLWKVKGGDCYLFEEDVEGLVWANGRVMGLSKNREITEVYGVIESFKMGQAQDREFQEQLYKVEEDGYFSGMVAGEISEEMTFVFSYIEGRNKAGEVLYRWGKDGDGNLFYE